MLKNYVIVASVDTNPVELDSNCACPSTNAYIESTMTDSDEQQWQIAPFMHIDYLDMQSVLVCNTLGNQGPVVLNQAAFDLLKTFQKPQSSTKLSVDDFADTEAIEQFQQLNLIEPFGNKPQLHSTQSNTLVAWMHTTNACNLRCTYCYIDKTEEAMPEIVATDAVDAVFRSAQQHGFSRVKLKYAGGEATLNFGLVTKLHDYAMQCSEHTGIALDELVLSNGVALTKGMLGYMRDNNMALSVSLDGLGEGHDAQRVFLNGKGSSEHVKRSIERAVTHAVKPHLSITVTAQNSDDAVNAVHFALDHNLLFNLNFYRENEASASQTDLLAEDAQMVATMDRCFEAIEQRLPTHSLLGSLVDRANFGRPHENVCGVGDSYMVIDQKGQVARCQMEIERSVTDIWATNPLGDIRLYGEGFQNVSVDEMEGCRSCSWRYWCAGGCPSLTYRVTGRSDVKSPYCHVYKEVYPKLLRLEGLRLLQAHNASMN